MENNSPNVKQRNPLKAWIVGEVAKIHRVTNREVYQVLNTDRNNQKIVESYMTIHEGATKAAMMEDRKSTRLNSSHW